MANINREYGNNMLKAGTKEEKVYWRNKLVELNMPIAEDVLNEVMEEYKLDRYVSYYNDLKQEAYLLLVGAIDKWKPCKGAIAKHCTKVIGSGLHNVIVGSINTIHIKPLVYKQFRELEERYKDGSNINIDKFCKENRYNKKDIVAAAVCSSYDIQSLDSIAGYDEDGNKIIMEEIVTDNENEAEEEINKQERKRLLDKLIQYAGADSVEMEMLKTYMYGEHTYKTIGQLYGRSIGEVRSAIHVALRALIRGSIVTGLRRQLEEYL